MVFEALIRMRQLDIYKMDADGKLETIEDVIQTLIGI